MKPSPHEKDVQRLGHLLAETIIRTIEDNAVNYSEQDKALVRGSIIQRIMDYQTTMIGE